MRKLVLALAVLVALVWIGWRMLPGPTFAPIAPGPAIEERMDRRVGPPGRPLDEGVSEVRRDLRVDEERGGHTIARHVGRTDAQLRERLDGESISAASTYTDLDTAERVVGMTLRRHAARVERWEAREGPRPNLVLPFAAPDQPPIGRVLRRGAREAVEAYAAVVVLRWRPDGSFVLTSYPEERPRGPQRSGRRGGPAGRQDP